MRCVFLEEEKVKDKSTKTCQAGIGTSAWEPDKDTINDFCENGNFPKCPRLHIFMEHAIGTSTFKVKTG